MAATHRRLAPAPPKVPTVFGSRKTFFDLPAELRNEIYKLALQNVTIHITPLAQSEEYKATHALIRTSKQVRNEVLPIMQEYCPIRCDITDFNFEGLLAWMERVPASEEKILAKNKHLTICFNTTGQPPRSMESLRKWLKMRSDVYRPQPKWTYIGPRPASKVSSDLKRRAKRMKAEPGKQRELFAIIKGLAIPMT